MSYVYSGNVKRKILANIQILANVKVLVTGSAGMLAQALIPQLRRNGANVILSDHPSVVEKYPGFIPLDITNKAELLSNIGELAPNWIINCAAYTAVDKAETESELALLVNGNGAGNCALAAAQIGARLLHISSDYVFCGHSVDGTRNIPFTEDESMNPLGVYSESKTLGDTLVLEHLPRGSCIVRTSWLHGINGSNFVDTMLRLGGSRDSLSIVNDQFGSPTWAGWLAQVIVQLIEREASGIFHAASRGNISWYDFSCEIFKQAGMDIEVSTQTSAELNRPAFRPLYSTLDVSKLEEFLGGPCISWKHCVEAHLRARGIIG